MTVNHTRLVALLAAVAAAAALRLVPHPWNFTPIGAMALFSGAQLGRRPLAFITPLAALLLSDVVLGLYRGMDVVYPSVALLVMIGWWVGTRRSVLRIAVGAVASSVAFFLITNLGQWLFSGIYPVTKTGLVECFVAAIPFFQNTVAGDLFYSAVLFGGFALLERSVPALRSGSEPQPA